MLKIKDNSIKNKRGKEVIAIIQAFFFKKKSGFRQ